MLSLERACQGLPTESPSICLSFAVGKPTVLTDPCRLPDSLQLVFWWEERLKARTLWAEGGTWTPLSPFFSWRAITERRLSGANSLEQCVLPSKQLVGSMHILVPLLPLPTLVWLRLLISEIKFCHKCITGFLACSVSLLFIYPRHACHLNLVELSLKHVPSFLHRFFLAASCQRISLLGGAVFIFLFSLLFSLLGKHGLLDLYICPPPHLQVLECSRPVTPIHVQRTRCLRSFKPLK